MSEFERTKIKSLELRINRVTVNFTDKVDKLQEENEALKALVIECVDTFKDMLPQWAEKIMMKLQEGEG